MGASLALRNSQLTGGGITIAISPSAMVDVGSWSLRWVF
jgi:hypothetical protein